MLDHHKLSSGIGGKQSANNLVNKIGSGDVPTSDTLKTSMTSTVDLYDKDPVKRLRAVTVSGSHL